MTTPLDPDAVTFATAHQHGYCACAASPIIHTHSPEIACPPVAVPVQPLPPPGPSSGDMRGCCASAPGAPHVAGCLCEHQPDPQELTPAPAFTVRELATFVDLRDERDVCQTVRLGDVLTANLDDLDDEVARALRSALDHPGHTFRAYGFVGAFMEYTVPVAQDDARTGAFLDAFSNPREDT